MNTSLWNSIITKEEKSIVWHKRKIKIDQPFCWSRDNQIGNLAEIGQIDDFYDALKNNKDKFSMCNCRKRKRQDEQNKILMEDLRVIEYEPYLRNLFLF